MAELKIKISDQPYQFGVDDRFFSFDLGYLSLKTTFFSTAYQILSNAVENIVLTNQETLALALFAATQTLNLPSIGANNLGGYRLHIKNFNNYAIVNPFAGDYLDLYGTYYKMSNLESITLLALDMGGAPGLWEII